MTLSEFKKSLEDSEPPKIIGRELKALWYDAKGSWDKAHFLIQSMPGRNAAWVHAYLHRKEPDEWNANYWYSRAEKSKTITSFEDEWIEIVKSLL